MIVRATKQETEALFRDRLDRGRRFEKYKKRYQLPLAAIAYKTSSALAGGAGGSSINLTPMNIAIGDVAVVVGVSNLPSLTMTMTCAQLSPITKLGTWNDSTNAMTIAVWVAPATSANASATINVSTSGSPGATAASAALYTGCNTSSPYENWNNGAFNVGSGVMGNTGNVTLSRTDDYLVCCFGGLTSASDSSWAASSGFALRGHTIGGSPSMGVAITDMASGGSGTFSGGTSVTSTWQGQGIIIGLQTPGVVLSSTVRLSWTVGA